MKRFLILVVFSVCSLIVNAQNSTFNHIVKKGETLYKISAIYKVPVEAIKQSNPHVVGDNIKAGDRLLIPMRADASLEASAGPIGIGDQSSVTVEMSESKPFLLEDDFAKYDEVPVFSPATTSPNQDNDLLKEVKDIIEEPVSSTSASVPVTKEAPLEYSTVDEISATTSEVPFSEDAPVADD